ncbi:MAG: pitrilysin family protein [Bryobacteraceae bacterium]|nr:pitrilysin family protein [Bryobacteraceae bacterium]
MTTRIAVFAAALLTAGSAWAQPALPKGFTRGANVEGITEYRLENGLRVLLFPDPSKPKVTVNVTYMVGSKHENYGETGMAHLLEHLLFKGTDKYPKIMQLLKDRGALYNGSTWYDRTNYFETLTASDENLRWAIDMEAERMVKSWVAKTDLDTEMTVVRNEFEMGENSPMRVLMQRTAAMAYDWHNYGKSTIGARSDIENVPIDRLQAFYRRFYQPDNALLVIAGKFDEAKTLGWIAESFGRIPKPDRVLPKVYTSEPVQDGERTVTVKRVGDEQLVMTVHRVPAGTHADYAAVSVLTSILGDSPTGRLYKALVDNKKAASVIGFDFQLAEPGILYLGARLRSEQSMNEARQALIDTIESAAKEPPTAEEVERAKTKILKQIELHLASSDDVGVDLSEWASMGDWRMLFIHRDRIRKVSAADVQRVARTYLKQDNRTVGVFVPTAKPDRAEIPSVPDVAAIVKDYKGTEVIAQGEVFDPTPANVEQRAKRVQLPNGTKLVMLSKKNRGATVIGRVTLRYGDEKTLMGREADSRMAWSMLMRGSARHTRQQIQDEFDKLKARVNMGGGTQFGTANIQTVGPNLPAVLKLVAEVMREPAFPESEFEQVKQAALSGIESQKSQPQFLAMNGLQKHMNPYPKGDVRSVQTAEEQIEELKGATLAGAKKFYQDFFGGSSSAVITLVGDFDAAAAEKLARELFGDWKTPKPVERPVRSYQKVEAVNRVIETPDKANAMFMAGLNVPLSDDDADYPALMIANQVFGSGSSSRVFKRFRDKEGWSYGAGAMLNAPTKENAGAHMTYAILAPQNMSKLETGFREEVEKALKEGFTAEEVEKAKAAWQQQQAVMRAEDMMLLGQLSGNEYWGRTMQWQAALQQKVAALTPDQVNAAFRKYVTPEAISIFKAGDFKKLAASGSAQ